MSGPERDWTPTDAADAADDAAARRGRYVEAEFTETADAYDWTDAEDDIADAISDSMDVDWSSRDGARAVVAYLQKIGAVLP